MHVKLYLVYVVLEFRSFESLVSRQSVDYIVPLGKVAVGTCVGDYIIPLGKVAVGTFAPQI